VSVSRKEETKSWAELVLSSLVLREPHHSTSSALSSPLQVLFLPWVSLHPSSTKRPTHRPSSSIQNEDVVGAISAVVWSLTLVPLIKYVSRTFLSTLSSTLALEELILSPCSPSSPCTSEREREKEVSKTSPHPLSRRRSFLTLLFLALQEPSLSGPLSSLERSLRRRIVSSLDTLPRSLLTRRSERATGWDRTCFANRNGRWWSGLSLEPRSCSEMGES